VVVDVGEGRSSWSLLLAKPAVGSSASTVPARSRDLLREVDNKTLRAYGYVLDRNLPAVRETLAGVRLPAKPPAESLYLVSYYQTLLAEREGDYRSALAEIQKAVTIAQHVKLDRQQWLAEEERGLLLLGVGRFREAAQLFDRLRRTPHPQNSCEEAQLLSNQAWAALLARDAGEAFTDPTPVFERALEIYGTCKRVTAEKQVNVLINLALAHLQVDHLAQAKGVLARARKLEPRPPLPHALWWVDLEARIALHEARPAEALRQFAKLAVLAAGTGSADGRLRAAFGQARAQQALGERVSAVDTLRNAELLLDEQSLRIPVQQGRATFMATRQAVVSLHVEILLEQGLDADALSVARRARSRALRQLEHDDRLATLTADQRQQWDRAMTEYQERRSALEERAKDDWRLPADQFRYRQALHQTEADATGKLLDRAFLILGDPADRPAEPPPLRDGELVLAYHPLPTGWVAFAADGKTVLTHRFALPPTALSDAEELARLLLLPFRGPITRARRIRVLPSGILQGVDFHGLPFEGDVLLASAPVVYGLDLPVTRQRGPAAGRRALLVADPRDDLPGALDEAESVRKVLRSGSRPWAIVELKKGEASALAVRERLAGTDLLHYAGHGTFSGFGGWESSLLLAGKSELSLGDLLALRRVPTWVVLSACDTAKSSNETAVESLGLANAFLLAGSRAVVASTRPADDRTVPELFVELYQRWDGQTDLAAAVQGAQLAWRKRRPAADWASFRLFEP